jgi:hypothetical protein
VALAAVKGNERWQPLMKQQGSAWTDDRESILRYIQWQQLFAAAKDKDRRKCSLRIEGKGSLTLHGYQAP